MAKRALILLTSHAELGDTGKPTGFYWEELATPYWQLRDAGYEIDFASPRGGLPPADPKSAEAEGRPESVQRFMDDEAAMAGLHQSKRVAEVNADSYAVIYLPGGHGAMWDLAQTKQVGAVIAQAYENGAVVGAVCHGPAGLTGARLSNGDALVRDKRVNSFTDSEEQAAGLTEVVPYLLESRLRELDASFEANDENFGPYAVRDGRLVTGQNPASSEAVGRLLLEALDKQAGRSAA